MKARWLASRACVLALVVTATVMPARSVVAASKQTLPTETIAADRRPALWFMNDPGDYLRPVSWDPRAEIWSTAWAKDRSGAGRASGDR